MSERVVVAMSGGVDSAVAAAILKARGYDVIGVAMKLWEGPSPSDTPTRTCCSAQDMADARRVADIIDIPFYVLNYKRRFEKEVVSYFVEEYFSGRTPNPCILCNSEMKFTHLMSLADRLGADYLATGHYARIEGPGADGGFSLLKGVDGNKDQSYFLFNLTQGQLGRVLFPLGGFTKGEVRKMAGEFGLNVADKEESQEICFVPGGDYRVLLEEDVRGGSKSSGPIVDGEGNVWGVHGGLHRYTVGQRRGLGIAAGRPLYVTSIDVDANTITVGDDSELIRDEMEVEGVSWINSRPEDEIEAMIKIRYRHAGAEAMVQIKAGGHAVVKFTWPQRALTPGQAAVFYNGEVVLGGGWISRVLG